MIATCNSVGLMRVADSDIERPLFDCAGTREIEGEALTAVPTHGLMERAGGAVARLALAVAPHAGRITVLAGPGNNGGDGLVAARVLAAARRRVRVVFLADPARLPTDALAAWQAARAAGVTIEDRLSFDAQDELVVDALLGLGTTRAPDGAIRSAIEAAHRHGAPILAVDLPTGLQADTGQPIGPACIRARWTLSLLTLKPGLFTAAGRDHAGEVWLDGLGVDLEPYRPRAYLGSFRGPPGGPAMARGHAQHKGSFGDVWVIGGAAGMRGAAVLAARAALRAGAGRVYLCPLQGPLPALEGVHPELMQREPTALTDPRVLSGSTVVCGCGGGRAIGEVLPAVLHHAARLVLDADALNSMAADTGLATALQARGRRGAPSVLTPHPLEAARLLGIGAPDVQSDRLAAAQRLAQRCGAWVVLKGSGTIVADPAGHPWINPTGNALLASAGTGDVLAGWVGGTWSAEAMAAAEPAAAATAGRAARRAVWLHGKAADAALSRQGHGLPLPAGRLVEAIAAAANAPAD